MVLFYLKCTAVYKGGLNKFFLHVDILIEYKLWSSSKSEKGGVWYRGLTTGQAESLDWSLTTPDDQIKTQESIASRDSKEGLAETFSFGLTKL